jgi:hypothetical protein
LRQLLGLKTSHRLFNNDNWQSQPLTDFLLVIIRNGPR